MRFVVALLLFCFLLLPLSTFSLSTFAHDKYLHFNVSFSLTITSNYFFGCCGDFIAFGIGIIKEVYDYYDTNRVADPEDIYSDIIGIIAAETYLRTLSNKPFIGFSLVF